LSLRWLFALVGVVAALAGTALWLATRPASPSPVAIDKAPPALWAASFRDVNGGARALGEYQGRVMVLNFWATWCAPCREEMPGFQRLQAKWPAVRFVGLSAEDAGRVAAFARNLGITYPLWVGGDEVGELSKRLGNTAGVLPHTVVFDASGKAVASKVGAYSHAELEGILLRMTPNVAESATNGG
jgi:thiol-disulfide isomerase/thioredoxin